MTGVELDLFSEEQQDLYMFFEAAKRGGLSTISKRHVEANIPGRSDFDSSKPNKWIMYWDANNLYVSRIFLRSSDLPPLAESNIMRVPKDLNDAIESFFMSPISPSN